MRTNLSDIKNIIQSYQPWLEKTYKWLHANPELSMQETGTVQLIEKYLTDFGYETQKIGGGIVGIIKNYQGPTVLYRADIDGLPVKENSDVEYASKKEMKDSSGQIVPVMHACGHDFHISAGLASAKFFSENKDKWSGTYIALFQPGEETAEGAISMVQDDLALKIPKPNIVLGQHVLSEPVLSGQVGTHAGPILSTATSIKITIHGKGSHGSMPHKSIDPVVIASSIVLKLQTLVSREIDPLKMAVLTVGSIQAGTKSNIIPDNATLLVNIRAYDNQVRTHLIDGIKRIVKAECIASSCQIEPEFSLYDSYPLTNNDLQATEKITLAFKEYFGAKNVIDCGQVPASEDFSNIPDCFNAPYSYWTFGGFFKDDTKYPNHNPAFAPRINPTIQTGASAAIIASMCWLGI